MPTEKNRQIVAELTADFKNSPLVIAAEYRGLDVSQMHRVRAAIRQTDSKFKVAKNTLARIAADNADMPQLKEIIDGPIGFMTSNADPAAAAKVLVKYIGDNSIEMKIVGGTLEGRVLSAERIDALAKLPPRDQLLAKLLGTLNSPITGLVTVMNGPLRAFATVLQAIVDKAKDAEGADAEPAPAGA
jgi:large subunit ribosomal protein L10